MRVTTHVWAPALLSVLLVAGCQSSAPEPDTSAPTSSGPPPVAEIAALSPDAPSPGPYDDEPAVQVVRMTALVLAWANLTDSIDFAQFAQYVDPASEPNVIGLSDLMARYEYVKLGPTAYVVEAVTRSPDDTVVLRLCGARVPEVEKASGDLREWHYDDNGSLVDATLTPLTDEEIDALSDLGLEPPPLRVRDYQSVTGSCDTSDATVQEFAGWEQYAPIGAYGTVDPMGVTVVGEDGTEVRDRDEMP